MQFSSTHYPLSTTHLFHILPQHIEEKVEHLTHGFLLHFKADRHISDASNILKNHTTGANFATIGSMASPKSIRDLVATFRRKKQELTAVTYKEFSVQTDFLNPFFAELGWDIQNKQGLSENKRDVIQQHALRVGATLRAPDYNFGIGRDRKFIVEAKKPSVNIRDDAAPAMQARSYGWNADLPLAILTDFEEFAVYDCRTRPKKNDKPATSRIFYCTYEQFEEKWDEIAAIFSRVAVLSGSFDHYAETATKHRGTETVDAALLKDIDEWRRSLATNIANRNESLSEAQVNYAVQKIIDRILFLRICEDRGIESRYQLQPLLNGHNVYGRLVEIFHDADARYNSGLFHFREEAGISESPDAVTPDILIDDAVLRKIISHLYYPESPYNFSVLPPEILGQVYEQFLGKVIRLTAGHHAKVEEKPEVRKAGGVYYTPSYIVSYIVAQTVGKLLQGKTPKQVAKLTIVDPACGSGSFLLGAYQTLLDWHLDYYMTNDPKKWKKELYLTPSGDFRLTTAERKRILLANIYGVDLDAQAVEVTKLSLLLKVLEGESEESLGRQMELLRQRVLPSLSDNIKCGNSLIGPDFYASQQMGLMENDEQMKVNAFDWKREFPEIFLSGGFDAVIGNPPYVVVGKEDLSDAEIQYLHTYPVAQYKMDLFHLFIQKGIDLLRDNGGMGFIIPNTWLTLQFTEKLRKYILDNSSPDEIVLFNHRVFQDAEVHTMLLFLTKKRLQKSHVVSLKIVDKANSVTDIDKSPSQQLDSLSWAKSEGTIFETRIIGEAGRIVQKLLHWPVLESVARASLGCQAYNSSKHTKEQIENRVFHSSKKLSNEYLPELAGNDVSRYLIQRTRGMWIKYGSWLHDYRSMDWLQGPRILLREITGHAPYRIQACYVEDTYCNYKTILNVSPSANTIMSMKYLSGLLNSKLISFLYPYLSNKIVSQTFPRLSVGDLKKLPIRTIDFSDPKEKSTHDRIVTLVDHMLELHKRFPAAKTPHEQDQLKRQINATDAEIDEIVYGLYGVSEEERRIVEGEKD